MKEKDEAKYRNCIDKQKNFLKEYYYKRSA